MASSQSDSQIATDSNFTSNNNFTITEYSESVNAYFKGVEIGVHYIRLFFIVNPVLFGGLISLLNIIFDESQTEDYKEFVEIFLILICIVGLTFSIGLVLLINGYKEQLNNCAQNAANIEGRLGGNLYKSICKTSGRKFNSIIALYIITISFSGVWFLVSFKVFCTLSNKIGQSCF